MKTERQKQLAATLRSIAQELDDTATIVVSNEEFLEMLRILTEQGELDYLVSRLYMASKAPSGIKLTINK